MLCRWLSILCFAAAVAAGRALFFPPWPSVQSLSPAGFQHKLEQYGLQLRQQAGLDAHPGLSRSLSRTLVWRLSSGEELLLVNGRMRDRQTFQVAALTQGIPALAMTKRRINNPETGVATGIVQQRPGLQTCLVSLPGRAPITALTLEQLKAAVAGADPLWSDQLRIRLGFPSPSRTYACLLVTLRSGSSAPLPAGLWPRVRSAVVAALAEQHTPGRSPLTPH